MRAQCVAIAIVLWQAVSRRKERAVAGYGALNVERIGAVYAGPDLTGGRPGAQLT